MADPVRTDLAPMQLGRVDDITYSHALASFQRAQDPEIEGIGFDLMFELGACGIDSVLEEIFGTSRPTEAQLMLALGSWAMADVLAGVFRNPGLADMSPGSLLF